MIIYLLCSGLKKHFKYPIIKSVQLMSDFMLCKISKNKSKRNSFTLIPTKIFGLLIGPYFKYPYEDLTKDSILNLFINVTHVNLHFL